MKKSRNPIIIRWFPRWSWRALFLVALGIPALTGWPITTWLPENAGGQHLLAWTAYGLALWMFMLTQAGSALSLSMLSIASVFAVVTVLSGAVFAFILQKFPINGIDYQTAQEYLLQGVIILTVVPYALFFAMAFPSAEIARRLAAPSRDVRGGRKAFIVGVKMIQNALDVGMDMPRIWREEQRTLLAPYVMDSSEGSSPWARVVGQIRRVLTCLEAFSLALFTRVMAHLPPVLAAVREPSVPPSPVVDPASAHMGGNRHD